MVMCFLFSLCLREEGWGGKVEGGRKNLMSVK